MGHDFNDALPRFDSFGNSCTNIGGIMDYDGVCHSNASLLFIHCFYSIAILSLNSEYYRSNIVKLKLVEVPNLGMN